MVFINYLFPYIHMLLKLAISGIPHSLHNDSLMLTDMA